MVDVASDYNSINAIITGQSDKAQLDRIEANTLTIINKHDIKRYGFRVKRVESDPYKRVEYIYDAEGMAPVTMNWSTHKINYGSWKDVWFIRDNYPCMVDNNGVETYRLDPDDYSKKAAGGGASDYANSVYAGNAMSAIPLCWVKRYTDETYEYFIVCESQYDESYKAYAHTKEDGTIANKFYHAMFRGSVIDNKLRSLGGQQIECYTSVTQEVNYAKATGAKFSIRSYSQQALIMDLLTLIGKSENSQAVFGTGQTTGYNASATNQGKLDSSSLNQTNNLIKTGQFGGWNDPAGSGTHHVKVFHIEDFWGNRWERVLGLFQREGLYYIKMTPENGGYLLNMDANMQGYQQYPVRAFLPNNETNKSKNGGQKNTFMCDLGRLPTGTEGGTDSQYITDWFWIFADNYDHLALFGGDCNNGSRCGSRSLVLSSRPSHAGWDVGASLTLV